MNYNNIGLFITNNFNCVGKRKISNIFNKSKNLIK